MKLKFQVFEQNFEFNLRSLSDETLHSKVKWLVQEERNLLTPILHLLKEVEVRKLFSSMGYKSLFEYALKECGYSEDQAARRISAMRLLKELPEIEAKISSGELTLSNLNQAQTLFRAEKKYSNAFSKEQKLEVIKSLESRSGSEAERIILSHSTQPQTLRIEKIRPVSENVNELKAAVSDETLRKIEKLKGLLAHSNPNISLGDLLDKLCDLGIKVWDPGQKEARIRKPNVKHLPAPARVTVQQDLNTPKSKPAKRSHIPNQIRREVWRKSNSRCEICQSTYALEIDHIQPLALNGRNNIENLRLLCRNCNQRAAIQGLGVMQMEYFISRS